MKTANAIQGEKIARIARILKKDTTLVGLAWILRNGAKWRDQYEANKLKPYKVSYRVSGQKGRKVKHCNELEFENFLHEMQRRNLDGVRYNSVAITKG